MMATWIHPNAWKLMMFTAFAALGLMAGTAEAQGPRKVLGWRLAHILTAEDHRGPHAKKGGIERGNLKCAVEADSFGGSIVVDTKCWHAAGPPLNGPHWTKYRLDWRFLSGAAPKDMRRLARGESLSLHLKAARIDSLGDGCPFGYWVPHFSVDVPGPWGSGPSSYFYAQLKDRPGRTCFGWTDALKKAKIDYDRIYPFPMNKDTPGRPSPSEAVFPITLEDKDFDGGVLVVYASAGSTTLGLAVPGVWYVFRAVYEGEPWPPSDSGPTAGTAPGSTTGDPTSPPGGLGIPGGVPGTPSDPGSVPGSTPGMPPGAMPGIPPGSPPGTPPGSLPGTPPDSPPGTPPGAIPGTPPGSPPGTPPGGPGSVVGGPGVPVGNRMTLVAAERFVKAGETVQVPVHLYNASDVANLNFTVQYDPVVAVAEEDPFRGNLMPAGTQFASNGGERGLLLVGFANTNPTAGNGTVAEARFRAVGNVGDSTPLTLAVSTVNNADGAQLPIALIHGKITIVGARGPCDCNGDGRITYIDAICPLLMSVRKMPVDLAFDLDNDGKPDSRDAVIILQIALGKRGL